MPESAEDLFSLLDLTEYEADALEELLLLGRTTAPDLAEATGIPKARIYGVLDALSEAGYVKMIPGRPKRYEPHEPAAIAERAVENRRHAYEQFREDVEAVEDAFVDEYAPVRDRGVDELSPTEDLFHVVDVGEPSERETRRLFREADEGVYVLSKSFGYIDAVQPAIRDAVDRGVAVDVLLLHPDALSPENRRRQAEIRELLAEEFPSVTVRVSDRVLPWRGTFIDPSLSYESGQGLLMVEQEEVPNHHRQAAVTENPAFVAGMWQYFDLLWRHESVPADPHPEGGGVSGHDAGE
ncbi:MULTISPECIES: TrmB family transcriptional regulator [unclassified Halorubrum]|uniref:TrmB family transcriptional regulator n=1 Tax=unclassified Halorubrum TaxID=2642239 RepID=UPI0010F74047|nr:MULTISPECIES: helix-turn-helix domain-containing protein [unclassified Halorubrum]TKX46021.1 TrmB family transcriptional regulator [Halorubrum sp. ARQ200]TKX50158.1 TrmB family transcriptional regulator [Halorubrum sp. ASP121]